MTLRQKLEEMEKQYGSHSAFMKADFYSAQELSHMRNGWVDDEGFNKVAFV